MSVLGHMPTAPRLAAVGPLRFRVFSLPPRHSPVPSSVLCGQGEVGPVLPRLRVSLKGQRISFPQPPALGHPAAHTQ